MSPRRALWGLIAVTTLLRLAWATGLGPGNDEAYHYLFTVHRDWSYYDHPPMTGLVEAVGLGLAGGKVSVFALRLGFIALFAGSTWLMARLTSRFYGDRAGLIAALVLNGTAYYGIAASTFALPDGPLAFFWLLTLDRLAAALAEPDRLRPWLGVGLAWGCALLSKYHAIFLPAGAFLYFLAEPSARRWLRRPGPYLATAIGLAVFAPVIVWNAAHGWASFAFQGERAMGSTFQPLSLLRAIGGQVLYLFPWIWLALVVVMVRHGRRFFRDAPPADRLLLCQGVFPLAAFLVVACRRDGLPHWSLVGFLAVLPMLGRDWAERAAIDPRRIRRRLALVAVVPIVGVSVVAAHASLGLFQRGGHGTLGLIPPDWDPTLDTYGWDQVATELRRRGLVDRPGTFLFTSRWYHSGHLAFSLRNEAPVLCYSPRGAHGFAHWSRPGQWVGQDGILVVVNESSEEPGMFDKWFRRIEPIGVHDVVRAGARVRRIFLYRCVQQTWAFPYDLSLPAPSGRQVAQRRADGPGRPR